MSSLVPPEAEVTTLARRKSSEAHRRKAAADAAVRDLHDHARERGGRFVLFGSYVDGVMRFDSDLDVLVDFPADRAVEAWIFAEDVARRHAIPIDLHDASTSRAAFVDRVRQKGRLLQ
ncbi:hypothetical protein ASG43_19725 [Aureimonas sp. Leaf454]|uniref:nucleotidyltransferase family protein n=1 Tax=Aureimonas sp. Leaf454 TaxID=1736381 RepID=UPI0006FD7574|nr:nucleotidyltransferase domain-containing protein [Aureimonas sp. Leaf454]KQT52683.1 hypothetical protein ASG43_19725 [Aureimonas sp. Leaf454]